MRVGADGTGLIRRGKSDAVVLVNGVQLGNEPSPILHGDKVEVGGHELAYGDDKKSGSTQFISAMNIPDSLKAKAGAPRKPTTASGGRLVSLVDGREYSVSDAGVTFGREIGCDIVIASTDVSRKHAQIGPAEGGYVLSDLSTNGVFVNGARVEQKQVLGRGDVVKIGPEEFRFYADVAKPAPAASATPPVPVVEAPAPAAPPAPRISEPRTPTPAPSLANTGFIPSIPRTPTPVPPPVPVAPPAPPAVPVAAELPPADLPDFDMPMIEVEDAISAASSSSARIVEPPTDPRPAAPPVAAAPPKPAAPSPKPVAPIAPSAPARAAIATLEITNEGPWKGTKFDIYSALTNIGRGAHNDVAVNDESVSDSHAKILKRDGNWWLVDQGSTNGTYVGGKRVQGEQQLVGAPDVRFGGIKMMFKPAAGSAEDEGKGTRAIAAFNVDAVKKARATSATKSAADAKPEPATAPAAVPTEKKKGCAAMIAFMVAIGAAGATFVILLATRG